MQQQAEAVAARYRAVLDSVFTADPYQWAPPSALLRLASEGWEWLVAWVDGLKAHNPLLFRVFLVSLLLVWTGIFAHAAWLVWRTVRGRRGPTVPCRFRSRGSATMRSGIPARPTWQPPKGGWPKRCSSPSWRWP